MSGNIPIGDYANLKKRVEFAQNILRESEISVKKDTPTQNNNELSKFTTTFKFGKNAGKTAMDIVNENPSNYEAILKQNVDFLQGIIDKNPNGPYAESNSKFIAEINELLGVLKSTNTLASTDASPKSINFDVYNSGIKVPNASKVNEHGKTMVYTIKISMNTGMNIPYSVEIMNCYATCPKAGNVDMKSMEYKTSLSVRLTEAQLDELIDSIDIKKSRFEMLNAEHAAALEDRYSYYHNPIVKNYDIDESVIAEILTKLTK